MTENRRRSQMAYKEAYIRQYFSLESKCNGECYRCINFKFIYQQHKTRTKSVVNSKISLFLQKNVRKDCPVYRSHTPHIATTMSPLLAAHYYVPTTRSTPLCPHYSQHTTMSSLLAAHYYVPTTHSTLLCPHYSQHTTMSPLATAHYYVPTRHSTLLCPHYSQHTTKSPPPTVHY